MEREILFRGKRFDTSGEWVEGGYFQASEEDGLGTYIYNHYAGGVLVRPATVGQFIGLTDKNNVKIFEGDCFGNSNIPTRHIVFEDGKFCFNKTHAQGADSLSQDRIGRLEIIGNIHDNPELV